MPAKRKASDYTNFTDYFDFCDYFDNADSKRDEKRRRQLYASKVERCGYHEIFSHMSLSIPTQNVSPYDAEAPRVSLRKLYEPLAPFQIRLLHIEIGEFDEPLKTSLSTVDLLLGGGVVDPVTRNYWTYEAISHSWGDLNKSSVIYCNNKLVAIPETQYAMLKHLRSRSVRRCVWLDTVCIDQNNNAERSAQVGKMFTIFGHAQRVLIWLGLPKPRTAQIFKSLERMKATRLVQMWENPDIARHVLRSGTAFVPDMCSNCHAEFARGIDEISSFSWFYRTWVRQEVYASVSATLLCGSLEIPWPQFVSYIWVFANRLTLNSNSAGIELLAEQLRRLDIRRGMSHLNDKDLATGSLGFIYQLFDQNSTQSDSDRADLFPVLTNSSSFKFSDSKDVVYGVLGMSNTRVTDCGDGTPFLKIDYSWNASQVFCKATEYFIRREKCLDAMFLAQFYRDPSGKGASWCPFWPSMNCEPEQLRKLCHVCLLDRYTNRSTLEFDGKRWPRIIDAEVIDKEVAVQLDDFCSFTESNIWIEGHILGLIKARPNAGEKRKLIFTILSEVVSEPGRIPVTTNEGLKEACSEYTPLHIEHAVPRLRAFIKRVKHEAKVNKTRLPQEEIDRFCLASVPAATRDGDLFCFLRASSSYVVLRPFESRQDVCRVRFVGIAFASQDIFDKSKLMLANAHKKKMNRDRIYEEVHADIQVFHRIIQRASDDKLNKSHSRLRSDAGTNRGRSLTPDLHPRKTEILTPPTELDTRTPTRNIDPQARTLLQQHFNGPIKSMKTMFDIM